VAEKAGTTNNVSLFHSQKKCRFAWAIFCIFSLCQTEQGRHLLKNEFQFCNHFFKYIFSIFARLQLLAVIEQVELVEVVHRMVPFIPWKVCLYVGWNFPKF